MILRKFRAIFFFYRTFWLFTNMVTLGLLIVSIERLNGYFLLFLVYFLWFKLLSEVGVWYIVQQHQRNQFCFYHNLGLSRTVLFGGAFTLDLLIALLLIGITYQLRL
ncbi:hypothetical protein GCM10027347_38420 [Larkinella harenae]